jgi:hypothetical protein
VVYGDFPTSQFTPCGEIEMLRWIASGVLSTLIFVAPVAAQIRFDDITDAAGLREPLLGIMGHGGAWGDVDGDGLIDAYVGGFADRPDEEYKPAKTAPKNVLLKNLGDGKFKRMPQPAAEFFARTSGAVFADLDNDGDLDLYVANNTKGMSKANEGRVHEAQLRGSTLLRNDDGKLVDISADCGACPTNLRTARNIGVFDFNGDGLLDLFIVEDKFIKNPRSVLFKNQGGLKFVDVNKEVGLPDDIFGLGLAVADINGDARPDFFVGHSNRMFLSTKGDKFAESAALNKTFAWEPLDGEDWPCGAAFGDLNRDGRLDLVLAIHFKDARNRIFLNDGVKDGVPHFRDATKEVGLPAHEANKSPHVEIQDFDNDGWPDLYFSTATLDSEGRALPVIYRNLGVANANTSLPKFSRVEPEKAGEAVYFPAGPSGDFDNDGRIDLLLINWFGGNHTRLLRNVSKHSNAARNHWLDVKVSGNSFNRMGIGSQIKVYPAGKLGDEKSLLGFQELTTGYGYASGQPAVCHFGLGAIDKVDLSVRLPNGKQFEQRGAAVNQSLMIAEP